MYKKVLIATDGSELAQKAVEQGIALAKKLDAAVTFVTVTLDWSANEMAELAERGVGHPVEDYEKRMAARATKILSPCAEAAEKLGVGCTKVHVKGSPAAEGIVETAKNNNCDLIVMSSHGRSGVGSLLLGSVANKVLVHSAIPVLICR